MDKIGKSTYKFNNVYLLNGTSICGLKEFSGPLGQYFDYHINDFIDNEKSFEKCEIKMLKKVIKKSLEKENINKDNIDFIVSGDLNNQITASSYTLRDIGIPYLGIFGACTNIVQGIIISAIYLDNVKLKDSYTIASTCSHNLTAERTFRYPNEYGGQRANTYTSTVTGAASILLTNQNTNIKVSYATIGKVVDGDLKDPQDMGRAMAPACYHTIKTHINDLNIDIYSYDKIITGDLSKYGSKMLIDLFKEDNIDIDDIHQDTGLLIYDIENQDIQAGGSGCGCIGIVLSSYILDKLYKKEYKKILVCGTGALMNPTMLAQKESIPGICHAITLEVE